MSQKEFLVLLLLVYIGFAELTGEWMSQFPLCIVISEYQPADNQSGNDTCATLFEGIMRFFRFILDSATHDNVIAFGTILIAIFTFTLWRSAKQLWIAGERQLAHFEGSARRQQRAYVHVINATLIYANSEWNPNIRITIKNFGQTPAYAVSNAGNCTLSLVGTPDFMSPERADHRSDLGPTQDFTTTMIVGSTVWKIMKTAAEKKAGIIYLKSGEFSFLFSRS